MESTYRLIRLISLSAFGIISILIGIDLMSDSSGGATSLHLIVEFMLLAVSAMVFSLILYSFFKEKQTTQILSTKLMAVTEEKEKWKKEAVDFLEGLSEVIEKQFNKWKLTGAEKDVGFMLLKGFSLKEIADLRNTSEKTVQLQSQSIYKKSKLGNRSEFAAFFLEDLLPPRIK